MPPLTMPGDVSSSVAIAATHMSATDLVLCPPSPKLSTWTSTLTSPFAARALRSLWVAFVHRNRRPAVARLVCRDSVGVHFAKDTCMPGTWQVYVHLMHQSVDGVCELQGGRTGMEDNHQAPMSACTLVVDDSESLTAALPEGLGCAGPFP